MTHWVHDLSPFLVEFREGFGIRYYGLAYLLGFVAAWWLMRRAHAHGRTPLTNDQQADFLFALIIGVMAGGRLGHFLLYHPRDLLADPLSLLRVWEGGMASHGGFAGVAVAAWWFGRSTRVSMLHLGDLLASVAAPGLLFGRLANFINGELWGRVSDVPWAVIFPLSAPGTPVSLIEPRHPSQLYEAFAEGLLLTAYMQWRFWTRAKDAADHGRLCGEFLIGYAVARIACEFFREPDEGVTLLFGLNRGAVYSVSLIAAGVVFLVASRRRAPSAA